MSIRYRSGRRRGFCTAFVIGTALAALALTMSSVEAASCRVGEDSDGDGLSCVQETVEWGTSVDNPDTDGDGLSDGDEVYVYGTNPLVFDALPAGRLDGDSDGLYDDDESDVYFTDAYSWDTDGDGSGDGAEVYYGSDPNDYDSTP